MERGIEERQICTDRKLVEILHFRLQCFSCLLSKLDMNPGILGHQPHIRLITTKVFLIDRFSS